MNDVKFERSICRDTTFQIPHQQLGVPEQPLQVPRIGARCMGGWGVGPATSMGS